MEEIKTTYQGFAEIARIIREGKLGQLHIGDTISTRHTLRDRLLWRIIGINADAALDGTPETVTVMLCNPPIWCSFDGGRNLHRCVLICNPCGVFRRAAGLPERKVIQWQLFEITASRPRPT